MKKRLFLLLFVGVFLVLPLVQAQEQATYSGFERFVDNVKFFFSSGDKKVMLALEIREKEVYSAIDNAKAGEEDKAVENLQRARGKLKVVQEKVTVATAEEVRSNVNEVVTEVKQEENLIDDFEVYVLEEEKTQITAELVVVVEGKMGQTEVRVVEEKLGSVNNEIKNWVVENTVEGEDTDEGLTREIKTDIASGNYGGDDGLTPEIKTYVDVGGDDSSSGLVVDDTVVTTGGGGGDSGGLVESGGEDSGGTSGDDGGSADSGGTSSDGGVSEDSGGTSSDDGGSADSGGSSGGDGGDSGDSGGSAGGESSGGDSGDSGGGTVTGEVVKDSGSGNIIKRMVGWLFRK